MRNSISNLKKKGMQQNIPFEFISLKHFCELTDLSPSYVYKLTSENKLPHYKPFGKKVYFKAAEVLTMFESNRVASAAEHKADAINYVFNSKKGGKK